MPNQPYVGAYSRRRFSNYSADNAGSNAHNGSYNLSVTSADPTMGDAGYIKLAASSPFASAQSAETQVNNRGGGYVAGDSFRAVAKAVPGCHFVSWQTNLDGVGATTQNPIEFTLTKDTVLVARFAADTPETPANMTANISWNSQMGRVNGAGLVLSEEGRAGSGQLTASQGSTVSLTASPLAGYKFVAWHGGPVEGKTSKTVSFPMNGNYSIRAEFMAENQTPNTGTGSGVSGTIGTSGGGGGTGTGTETHSSVAPVSTGFSVMSFVKKWWWAILIVAYIVFKDKEGGSK